MTGSPEFQEYCRLLKEYAEVQDNLTAEVIDNYIDRLDELWWKLSSAERDLFKRHAHEEFLKSKKPD